MYSLRRIWTVSHLSSSYRSLTSKQLVYDTNGDPENVLHLRTVEIDSKPGPGRVRIRYLASPVNPADINQIQGVYPIKPQLPAVGGNEMVGEVEETGDDVSRVRCGDRVIASNSGLGTWQTYANIDEKDLVKIDRSLPVEAAATFQVNPPTAYRMLKDFINLKPGDLIIQNGSNSAVGRAVIQLAKIWGFRTVNIIRERPDFSEVADELRSFGADKVIGERELQNEKKNINARLALNCVGGRSALLLISCLGIEGVMVTYGGMSKQLIQAPTGPFIFKNIQLRGFWISQWYKQHENEKVKKQICPKNYFKNVALKQVFDNIVLQEREKMFSELTDFIQTGKFRPPNFDKLNLDDWQKAISNTMKSVNRKQLFVF
ncbi:unnamed protein product [Thelazia callipaeda]|uniref:Enoyl-[acyl-carrier-protein] reductase, mitochondrial n=1 Tax=Thelazia callipaeda TaxID=103827 RepID=A0A0N5D7V2_THECL|nr:unnamed protein product [Thelazia callipaeda]